MVTSKSIQFYVTKEEEEEIKNKAKVLHLPMSSFCRMKCLSSNNKISEEVTQ